MPRSLTAIPPLPYELAFNWDGTPLEVLKDQKLANEIHAEAKKFWRVLHTPYPTWRISKNDLASPALDEATIEQMMQGFYILVNGFHRAGSLRKERRTAAGSWEASELMGKFAENPLIAEYYPGTEEQRCAIMHLSGSVIKRACACADAVLGVEDSITRVDPRFFGKTDASAGYPCR